ncbi:MAG: GIY-YIG nuclease family protein [Cyclobacteriaceae bacterium]
MNHNYFVYIATNKLKTVLYTGMTNDLRTRMEQHGADALNGGKSFAGKYNCFNLIYWERFQYVRHAIEREKEIKGWKRFKKEKLINEQNPEWIFLNDQLE